MSKAVRVSEEEMSKPEVHPPGLVGVIANDTARFSMFAASLTSLEVPEGTKIKWIIGHEIAANTNMLVRAMLASDAEWLWVLGDDHVFSPQILNQMLSHDVDIVVPLCLMRFPPYKPVVFTDFLGDSAYRIRLNLDDFPDGGLISVHSAGSGGMLVRRSVFEYMDDPWFETGRASSTEIGEDFFFCDKARAAGYEIHADLETRLGHVTTAVVWPVKQPDGWTYGFGFSGGFHVTVPVGTWEEEELDESS